MESFFDKKNNKAKLIAKHESEKEELYVEIGRLTTQSAWLKKNLESELTRDERVGRIEWEGAELPIVTQAELLGLNRSGLYYKPVQPCEEEIKIKHRIDEIYTRYPFYGSRRVRHQLAREGYLINRKRVQRYMREMAIAGICPGPNLSRRNLEHKVFPYLLRDLEIERAAKVWGIDITYIRLFAGWLYMAAILDWYSRYVLSWELDQTLETGFVMEAVNRALLKAHPEIFNSDQGSHFTSSAYINRLQKAGVQISMDSKGRALDNIFTERLWRTIKYEEVYLNEYSSPRRARQRLTRYMTFYNDERPHQSLLYKTPAEVCFGHSIYKEKELTATKKKGEESTLNQVEILS